MGYFSSALWIEALKMYRSRVPFYAALGFGMAPLAGGLFMFILKDPEAARSLGLITTKAQLLAGSADWPSFFGLLAQAVAAAGAVLFSILTTWVFGREFSDHTVKELLAVPTPRGMIVAAKFAVVVAWALGLTLLVFGLGLLVGALVRLPGWTAELPRTWLLSILGTALLTVPLMSFVALLASAGRGYLPPFGWTVLTLVVANLAAVLGWGDWFPWSVPGLFSGAAGPRAELLGLHSYVMVAVASALGLVATFMWWRDADQTR